MTLEQDPVYRFGDFELDARRRILRSAEDGRIVELTPKAFDLLLQFVERPGELLEKGPLLDSIWPNVVVEENNLTRTVSSLRRALGERPQEHRYVITIPGRGYRFAARVDRIDATGEPAEEPAPASSLEAGNRRRPDEVRARAAGSRGGVPRRAIAVALAVVVLFGVALSLRQEFRPEQSSSAAGPTITRSELIAANTEGATEPTFSPDGMRAAFVGDVSGVAQLYVINLERGDPRQLTNHETGVRYPSWSPRDDRIVYQTEGAIWSIDPLGTLTPRKIIDDGIHPSFSRDGAHIVFEHGHEIRIAGFDGTGQTPVAGVPFGDRLLAPAFPSLSPDGTMIAFFQQKIGPLGDYWVIPSDGGTPRQLTFDLHWGGRPVWMPDGSRIVFPSKRGGTLTLWTIPAGGGEAQPLTTGLGEDTRPAISPDGSRLLYATSRIESRFVVTDPATLEASVLIRHRRLIAFPRISPDGQWLVFFSEFEPREQVMVMSLHAGEAEQLTEYRPDEANVFPRWSHDGSFVYYYQNLPPSSFRRVPVAGGPAEEVLSGFSWDFNVDAEWNPTGTKLSFVRIDAQSRQRQVVVKDPASGTHTVLSAGIQYAPMWSADGNFLLGTAQHRVLVCPVDGDECRTIVDFSNGAPRGHSDDAFGHYARWSADESQIFFTRRTARPAILSLWAIGTDGSGARRLFDYGPVHPLGGRFQVLPGDRILWDRYDRGPSELVLATVN